jgi:hypothetical protein
MRQRPAIVPVIAAFLFLAAGIAAFVGISLLFRNVLLDRLWDLNKPAEAVFRRHAGIFGLFLLLLSAATLVSGVGMLRGRRWARWFSLVLFAVDGAGDLVNLGITGDWWRSVAGILICSVFLYALLRAPVRRHFDCNRGSPCDM